MRELTAKNAEEKKAYVDFYPHAIDFEVTSFCNFECGMCPHSIVKNRLARHMNLNILERMEPYLKHCSRVALQGDGEPFLNPDIFRIISFFEQRGIRLTTTTNLSVMNTEIADVIEKFILQKEQFHK